jgi:hypothetical protein
MHVVAANEQQLIQHSFDCMISRARRCIRAGGHAFVDEKTIGFEP